MLCYDIWCQYSVNLLKRFQDDLLLREYVQLLRAAQGLIGPLHIMGHVPRCQALFSASTTPGAGRTCGDNVESPFAETKIMGGLIKHMNDGGREDTLITMFTDHNTEQQRALRKFCSLASSHTILMVIIC
jgi:hypothetical protein